MKNPTLGEIHFYIVYLLLYLFYYIFPFLYPYLESIYNTRFVISLWIYNKYNIENIVIVPVPLDTNNNNSEESEKSAKGFGKKDNSNIELMSASYIAKPTQVHIV